MSGIITHEWNGTVLTITSDSGTSSADLKGAKGDDGARGMQGVADVNILSVNGKTGVVEINAADVGALSTSGGTVGNLRVDNGNSGGYVELMEDGEGGTIIIGSKNGEYIYEIDAYNDNSLRLHTARSHPDAMKSMTWWGDTGTLQVENLIVSNGLPIEADIKAQKLYAATGKIITNRDAGTAEAYGTATVNINANGIVKIEFMAMYDSDGSNPDTYGNGISPEQLNILNNNIPANIQPISGGYVNYIDVEGKMMNELTSYAGCMIPTHSSEKAHWCLGRIYTPDGAVGNWADNIFRKGMRVNGVCYGVLM